MGFRMRLFSSVAAVAILAACGASNTPSSGGTSTVSLKIMVGGLNKQIYLPNMLAQRLGYFKDEHLDVTLIDEGSGQASEEEVVAGNVDAGSGAYVHPMVLNTQGKKIETICQFGIAPGEAEVVDASLTNVKSAKDLQGKNLGVTDLGSGTHVLTQAILGSAGVDPTSAKYVAVGAGDTFIAAIQQKKIAAGMTRFRPSRGWSTPARARSWSAFSHRLTPALHSAATIRSSACSPRTIGSIQTRMSRSDWSTHTSRP